MCLRFAQDLTLLGLHAGASNWLKQSAREKDKLFECLVWHCIEWTINNKQTGITYFWISGAQCTNSWFQNLNCGFLIISMKVMSKPHGCGLFTMRRSNSTLLARMVSDMVSTSQAVKEWMYQTLQFSYLMHKLTDGASYLTFHMQFKEISWSAAQIDDFKAWKSARMQDITLWVISQHMMSHQDLVPKSFHSNECVSVDWSHGPNFLSPICIIYKQHMNLSLTHSCYWFLQNLFLQIWFSSAGKHVSHKVFTH